MVKHSSCIQELNFSTYSLADEGAVALGNTLPFNKSVMSIRLSNSTFRYLGIDAIGKGLTNHPSLSNLAVHRCGLGEHAEVLFIALQHCPELKELSVCNNAIGPVGGKKLALAHKRHIDSSLWSMKGCP